MKNETKIIIIISGILLLAGSYISLDWSRIFLMKTTEYNDSFIIVKIFKLTVSFLCALLVWTTFKDKFSKLDSIYIKSAFLTIFIGDLSFTTKHPVLGVSTFLIGQIILSIRNSNGLKSYLKNKNFKENKLYIIIVGIILLVVDFLILYFLFFKDKKLSLRDYGIILYSLALCISVWIAWISIKIPYFKKINSFFISIGMTFFFFCDLTVGYGLLENDPFIKEIVTSLTWVFYTPALVLLALSSYDFDKLKLRKII